MSPRLAAVGDPVLCPAHGLTRITTGAAAFFRNGKAIARVGDITSCGAVITTGAHWVFMDHAMAAREGDRTDHGGVILVEDPLINLHEGSAGDTHGPADSLADTAALGQALLAPCLPPEGGA